MKKIIYLILGVLLFLPALVKADSAAPGIMPYKATPKSSNGADIYIWDSDKSEYVKTDRKLAYGKVITVTWENDFVEVDQEDEENEDSVKLSDLVPIEKNYKVDEKNLTQSRDALTIRKLEIKKGPAEAYESTGKTIPVNAKIKIRNFQYYDKELKEYELEYTAWAYVEYNGTKGFINTESSVVFNGAYTSIICYQEEEIINVERTKIIATIKPNIKFNAMVYELDWDDGYYIEYGSIKGISINFCLVKRNLVTFKPKTNVNLYAKIEYDDNGNLISKPITTIPKDKTYTSNYYDIYNGYVTMYYEDGSVKGWIKDDDNNYDDATLDPEFDEEKYDYEYIYYILGIDYPKDDSFVAVERGANDAKSSAVTVLKTPKDLFEEDDEEEEETPGEETPTDPEQGGSSVAPDQPKTETKTKKKVPELVYYCLGAAVVVSITAVVTILLVNKKKKKTEEVKEETKEETPIEEKDNEKK